MILPAYALLAIYILGAYGAFVILEGFNGQWKKNVHILWALLWPGFLPAIGLGTLIFLSIALHQARRRCR
jgi:hypothetical protein